MQRWSDTLLSVPGRCSSSHLSAYTNTNTHPFIQLLFSITYHDYSEKAVTICIKHLAGMLTQSTVDKSDIS